MISRESRPRLVEHARLRFDRKTRKYMLLYPERGMILNSTAADILLLCTGMQNVDAIADRLRATHEGPRETITQDVLRFLCALERSGLVRDRALEEQP